jgi:hypothetical protein
LDLSTWQDIVAFLKSRDFAVNFVANLAGAMFGILLAFSIDRFRSRRETKMLYGRVLRTSRSELGYLKPMYENIRNALNAGKPVADVDTVAPATRALLINPLVHDRAPYSLIMALTVISHFFDAIETSFARAEKVNPQDVVTLRRVLARLLDKAINIITIVLEQIDA